MSIIQISLLLCKDVSIAELRSHFWNSHAAATSQWHPKGNLLGLSQCALPADLPCLTGDVAHSKLQSVMRRDPRNTTSSCVRIEKPSCCLPVLAAYSALRLVHKPSACRRRQLRTACSHSVLGTVLVNCKTSIIFGPGCQRPGAAGSSSCPHGLPRACHRRFGLHPTPKQLGCFGLLGLAATCSHTGVACGCAVLARNVKSCQWLSEF